ncbi:LuxR C-terminal-related transcriptional regulator [Oscillochloris sp. ZM17-4]|uniref:LuxR C-terminal-related transcriptional regulator n=1 Tax=Oscillochloris sp. ZM17-4 TaxID=2866714 RepID=UPI001C730E9B|nr:LuxR C-terminal-related transcriptional regulator [Oscillochloris sp. ZM17-4]MBX0330934.1 LuxR C-terminal-related transcriptional regulator [Oscillochloris sp. ZM17-4]
MLHAPQPAPLAVVVATLINSLAALPPGDGPGRPYVLVLDDYQFIEAAAIHEALALLIERLPPQLHLMITARADPPLPLARLRARGLVTELRAADLRCSREEARALLDVATGMSLSSAAIARLEARTEGWLAGLQLAGLALRDQPDPEAFVAAFAGSHHYIVDYLADEVLAHQPPHMRAFLLQTAILDRLCGPLCDAVVKDEGRRVKDEVKAVSNEHTESFTLHPASFILAQLERANLFLIPLDSERRWYRYHHLFADVLRARLRESAPEIVPELHRRASAWYAQQLQALGPAHLDAAVRHALAGGEVAAAAQLIAREAEPLLRRGGFAQLIRLLRALPDNVVRGSPALCLLMARALFAAADPEAMPPLLQAATESLAGAHLADAERAQLQGWLVALESQILRVRGSYAAAITRAHEALDLLPAGEDALRGFATLSLALAMHLGGRLRDAVGAYQTAIALQDADDRYAATVTRCLLGALQQSLGAWDAAAETYAQALAQAGQPRLPAAGWALIGMGELAYARDDLGAAEQLLVEGMTLAEQGELRDALPFGYAALALLRIAQGQPEAARAAGAAMARFAALELHLPLVVEWADAVAARVALAQGDLAAAARWAQRYAPPTAALFSSQAFALTTYLRLLIAAGRAGEALAQIGPQRERADAAGQAALGLELRVLEALAHVTLGQAEAAQRALDQALALAAPIAARRVFLDAGPPLAALLRASRAQGPAGLLRAQLLGALGAPAAPATPSAPPPTPPPAPLAEPLTPREHEILRWVAEGRSNQEIAAALVVSVGTVKTHLHNLYGKLEARDRTHAVARARAFGLLDEGASQVPPRARGDDDQR